MRLHHVKCGLCLVLISCILINTESAEAQAGALVRAIRRAQQNVEPKEAVPEVGGSLSGLGQGMEVGARQSASNCRDYDNYLIDAEAGDAASLSMLGSMFYYGRCVAKSYEEAFGFFSLAAAKGDAESQAHLGVMYHDGNGVNRDFVRSYMWLSLATSNGYTGLNAYLDSAKGWLSEEGLEKAEGLAAKCLDSGYTECSD